MDLLQRLLASCPSREVMERQTAEALRAEPECGDQPKVLGEAEPSNSVASAERTPPADPGWLARMRPQGTAWRGHLAARGLACPPTLIALADAMDQRWIEVRGWRLLDPAESEARRRYFVDDEHTHPALGAYVAMAPLFDRDGDLLLLAADGAVHEWRHDDWEKVRIAAADFDALVSSWCEGG